MTLDRPRDVVALYQLQYELAIESPNGLGNPQGAGYYDAGTMARISITSPLGMLVQQKFAGWVGDYSGESTEATILMDSPKTLQALWVVSYFRVYVIIAVTLALVALLVFWKTRNNRNKRDA